MFLCVLVDVDGLPEGPSLAWLLRKATVEAMTAVGGERKLGPPPMAELERLVQAQLRKVQRLASGI